MSDTPSAQSTIERLVKAAAKLNLSERNSNVIDTIVTEINHAMITQLIQMIHSTSTHVLESNLIDNSKLVYNTTKGSFNSQRYRQSVENNPKFLNQLIDLTFEQFKMSAMNYREFIHHASKLNQIKYQTNTIWTCIQNVLIQLLEEYLDIKHLNQSGLLYNFDVDNIDINSFFIRKRLFGNFGENNPNTPASSQLAQQADAVNNDDVSRIFAFKNSQHAMSIQKFNKEKNNEDLFDDNLGQQGGDDANSDLRNYNQNRVFKILVCQPDHRNFFFCLLI